MSGREMSKVTHSMFNFALTAARIQIFIAQLGITLCINIDLNIMHNHGFRNRIWQSREIASNFRRSQ